MKNILFFISFIFLSIGNLVLYKGDNLPMFYNSSIGMLPILVYYLLFAIDKTINKWWILYIVLAFFFFIGQGYHSPIRACWGLAAYAFLPGYCVRESVQKKYVFLILAAIVIFEMILSISEYIVGSNLFMEVSDNQRFRSSGIWGHPINNSILISMFMLFVVLSSFSLKRKIYIYTLCVVLLFIFDSRASIGITAISTILLVLFNTKNIISVIKQHPFVVIIITLIGVGLLNYISSSSLGEKIFDTESMALTDNSALARFNLFDYVAALNFSDLLYGISDIESIADGSSGFYYIECAPLLMILQNGAIIAIPLLILLFSDAFNSLILIDKKNRVILLLNYFVIGLFSPSYSNLFVWVYLYLLYILVFKNPYLTYNEEHY